MEHIGDVLYDYAGGLYINMTNRCPCRCDFCIRYMTDSLGEADSLWLKREPDVEELKELLRTYPIENYDEIVFCGYGEPTERLDCMLAICDCLKKEIKSEIKIRLNTNGLSDLINGRSTAGDFEGRLDAISVSLNAPDAEKYSDICHPVFGDRAFGAILDFTRDVKRYVPDVTMSVVESSIAGEDIEKCRHIAESMDVKFRIR